jgi:hypothetical protein
MSFRSFSVLAVIFSTVSISSAAALTPEFVRVATIVSSDKAHDILKSPQGIAVVKGTGDVIVADTAHHRLLKVSARGDVALLAGSGKPGFADGIGSAAQFKEPVSVAVDESPILVSRKSLQQTITINPSDSRRSCGAQGASACPSAGSMPS